MPLSRESTNPTIPDRVYERLMSNAHREGEHLVSDYSVGSHGYSQIGWSEPGRKKVVTLGHRAVWIHERGPIPDGMTVDHRQGECPQKCIEIAHLRLIPNRSNARRNQGRDFPDGQCNNGHPDSLLREYSRGHGKRGMGCSACRADYQRRYRAKKKEF